MAHSRTYYAKRNITFGMFNRLVTTIICPFAIRTIVKSLLGPEYLGLGSLFTAILEAFSMAELGFSSAIVFKMYKPMAENDEEKICALLAYYRKVYRLLGSGILVVGLILLPFIKYLIKGSYPQDINIYILYLIYLSGTVISYFGVAYKASLLSVAQRNDIISNVNTVLVMVKSFFQITLLFLLKNYYAFVIFNPLVTLANNIIIAYISKKLFPAYVCRGKLDVSELTDLKKQIKGLAIGKIGVVSRNSFDSIVLSMYCGLIDVTIYSNYYYIFSAVIAVLTIVLTSITGGVGNSLAIESKEKNYNDFKKFNFYFTWMSGWCTVCLFCLYQPFMKIWMGSELVTTNYTMSLFCIYFFVVQLGKIRSVYSGASGIWWEFRHLQIIDMLSNPLLNFILGYFWGMDGILWATIITALVVSDIGIGSKTMKFCFGQTFGEYGMLMAIYSVLTAVACLGTSWLCKFVSMDGVIGLFPIAGVCLIVPNVFFLVVTLLDPAHKGYLRDAMRYLDR